MTEIHHVPGRDLVEEVNFYSSAGPMTDLDRCPPGAFRHLPPDPVGLCRVVQGLLVHEEWAGAYDLELSEGRRQEVRIRPAAAMVDAILSMDSSDLATARRPELRMVGNCRHFATLSTALLRRAGIPARARCGFAAYFEVGRMVDHWVTEYWSDDRWVRIDAQLDAIQQEATQLSFDSSDVPSGNFLTAAEAWDRCRTGDDDPSRFGIFDMGGLWFIASNVIRDLAALSKVELLPWDSWGPMTFREDPDLQQAATIDRVAGTISTGGFAAIRSLYAGDEGLSVPGTVFDGRFGEPFTLNVE